MMTRMPRSLRTLAPTGLVLLLLCAIVLGYVACNPAERLTVRNLTTVAIVWNVPYGPQVVPACTTVDYIYDGRRGGWTPRDPSEVPSPAPSDAVPIRMPSLPGDAHRPDALVITETGVNVIVGDLGPPDRACAGVPQSYDILPSAITHVRGRWRTLWNDPQRTVAGRSDPSDTMGPVHSDYVEWPAAAAIIRP